jgi:phenylacetate-CoA ligase
MTVRYWSPGVETASPDEIARIQRDSLRQLMERCVNVPHYRTALESAGVRAADVRDLADLAWVPFFSKAQLRSLQPWGVLATRLDQVARFHATTGTTGLPCNIAFSRNDLDEIAELGARNLTAMGVLPGDIAWQSYGYGLWMGGSSLDRAFEAIGVTTFPAGPGRTTLAVESLADHAVTVISCTPTFVLLLAERAAELGRDQISEWRLRVGVLGGETMTQAARRRLTELMPPGFRPHNTYGTTELGGPFLAGTCEYGLEQGTFHVWADHYLIEIVDPDSGRPITEPGVPGELIVTTLRREASPMLRWRTRDLTAWAPDSRSCPCGRHAHPKISWIQGRSDDMVKVRGALVLPSQVEELISTTDGTGAGWQLVVDKDPAGLRATEATVYVEVDTGRAAEQVATMLAGRIADRLGVRIPVVATHPHELPRYEGKARRVLTTDEFAAAVPRPVIAHVAGEKAARAKEGITS